MLPHFLPLIVPSFYQSQRPNTTNPNEIQWKQQVMLKKKFVQEEDKTTRFRKKKPFNPYTAKGKWTRKQQSAYIIFMQRNEQLMKTQFSRKSKKSFVIMSNFVKTRDPDQCRSHHQKMLLYLHSIPEIIKYYRQTDLFDNKEDNENSNNDSSKCKKIQKEKNGNQSNRSLISLSIHRNKIQIEIDSKNILCYNIYSL